MKPEHPDLASADSGTRFRGALRSGSAALLRVIDGFAGVAMLLVAGWLLQGWWVQWGDAENRRLEAAGGALVLPDTPLVLSVSDLKGDRRAAVLLIEYADFQCPYCAKATEETVGPLIRQFVDTGKIRLAFQHVVLEQLHPFAVDSAVAVECAGAQRQFWPMHDLLFRNQHRLHPDGLREMAGELGLDPGPFGRCLADSAFRESVLAESNANKALGVVSTPTFVVATVVSEEGPTVVPVETFEGAGRTEEIRRALERLTK